LLEAQSIETDIASAKRYSSVMDRCLSRTSRYGDLAIYTSIVIIVAMNGICDWVWGQIDTETDPIDGSVIAIPVLRTNKAQRKSV